MFYLRGIEARDSSCLEVGGHNALNSDSHVRGIHHRDTVGEEVDLAGPQCNCNHTEGLQSANCSLCAEGQFEIGCCVDHCDPST